MFGETSSSLPRERRACTLLPDSCRLRWPAEAEVKPELITVSPLNATAVFRTSPAGWSEAVGALTALCERWGRCRMCLGASRSVSTEVMAEETRLFRLGKGVTHPSCCKCDILWCRVKSLSPLFPLVVGLNPYQFRPDRWISLGLWFSLIRLSAHKEKMLSVCW